MNEKNKLVCLFSPVENILILSKEERTKFLIELTKIGAEKMWWNTDFIFFFDEEYLPQLNELATKYKLNMKIEYPE